MPTEPWRDRARREWVRSAGVLTIAGLVSQALLFAGSLVVVTFYSPTEVGAVAAFISFLGICSVASALRYELSLPLIRAESEAVGMLRFCLVLVILTAAVAGAVSILVGRQVVTALHAPAEMSDLRFAVFPALILMGAALVFTQWVTRTLQYATIARARILQAGAQVALQASAGVAGVGAAGLGLATASATAAGAAGLSPAPWAALRRGPRPARRDVVLGLARQYWQLPTLSSAAVICQGVALGSVPILLGGFYDLRIAGLYAIAQRVVSAPMRTVGEAVARVYFGDAAALHRAERPEIRRRLRETAKLLAAISVLPAITVLLWAPALFALVFGEEWREAGALAQVMVPLIVAQFVAQPLSQTTTIFNRLDVALALAIMRLALTTGPLLVAHAMGASAIEAMAALSAGGAISYVASLFVIDRIASER